MTKKESCFNAEYTGGFKLTVEQDGTFVAVKGKNKLTANSANELYELIKKFNQSIKEQ